MMLVINLCSSEPHLAILNNRSSCQGLIKHIDTLSESE